MSICFPVPNTMQNTIKVAPVPSHRHHLPIAPIAIVSLNIAFFGHLLGRFNENMQHTFSSPVMRAPAIADLI